jgi:predicted RNase H-like nuclease (RuvC/YqgF family)
MPIKKRGKKTRSAKGRTARSTHRAAKPRKKTAPRRTAGAAKGRAAAAGSKKRAATPAGGAAIRALAALKARLEREKGAFEKRLTDTVREIAQLRHHEARAAQLERQLKERDELIVQLRTQLNELRNREIGTPDDDEVQPSLALGARAPRDLDEFDEDVGPEDDDELI